MLRNKTLYYGFIVCAATILPTTIYAGAWTLDEHAQQHIITYRHYKTDTFYDTDGVQRDKNGEFTKNELEYYVQYGVTPDVTLGISLAASSEEDSQQIISTNSAGIRSSSQRILTIEGLSRIEGFARYQLYRDDIYALAIQPTVKLPSLYTQDLPPQAQPDEWEGELALLGGRNFTLFTKNHYAEASIAYRHRLGDLGDQVKTELRFGFSFNDRFVLMPELQYTHSVDEINRNFATLSGSNNYHLLKGQLSGIYRVGDRTNIQAGAYRHLDGTNTGGGGGVLIALWQSF